MTSPLNRQELIGQLSSGLDADFLFFWGHRPSRTGELTQSCLSQWWPSSFVVEGTRYPTAEHWMMAWKARMFGDDEAVDRILAMDDPGKAKHLGRQVAGFDPLVWEAAAFGIVVQGNFHKFSSDGRLRKYLLASNDAVLVEASPLDPVWGIGMSADDPDAALPQRWRGENKLGFALMKVRDLLRGS